jgi:hypothetical protein
MQADATGMNEAIPHGTWSGSRGALMRVSAIAVVALLLNVANSHSSPGQTMNTGDPVKRGLTERTSAGASADTGPRTRRFAPATRAAR